MTETQGTKPGIETWFTAISIVIAVVSALFTVTALKMQVDANRSDIKSMSEVDMNIREEVVKLKIDIQRNEAQLNQLEKEMERLIRGKGY